MCRLVPGAYVPTRPKPQSPCPWVHARKYKGFDNAQINLQRFEKSRQKKSCIFPEYVIL